MEKTNQESGLSSDPWSYPLRTKEGEGQVLSVTPYLDYDEAKSPWAHQNMSLFKFISLARIKSYPSSRRSSKSSGRPSRPRDSQWTSLFGFILSARSSSYPGIADLLM